MVLGGGPRGGSYKWVKGFVWTLIIMVGRVMFVLDVRCWIPYRVGDVVYLGKWTVTAFVVGTRRQD